MIGLSKMAFETLKAEGSDKIFIDPKEWWKKSKFATIWIFFCLIGEIPLMVLRQIIMLICFIPHAIYEELDK